MVATRSGGVKRAREEEEEENNQLSLRANSGNFPIFYDLFVNGLISDFQWLRFRCSKDDKKFLGATCDLLPLGDLFFTML